jgi:hypothetical protein
MPGPCRGRACPPARSPRRIEQRIVGERGTSPGVESLEIAVEHALAWPVAGGVLHDPRRIDGDQAFVADVGSDRGLDALVILLNSDVQQPAVGIDNRDAGVVFLAPSKIEPNEVHTPSLPHLRRKLCVCDDP